MNRKRRRRGARAPALWIDEATGELLPDVVPWQCPLPTLDRARVLIVANTSVAWSEATTLYYCQQRGIPAANILPLALGSGALLTLADNAALQALLFTPLQALIVARQALAVLIGPGCPTRVNWDATHAGSGVDLQQLASHAPLYAGRVLTMQELVGGWVAGYDGFARVCAGVAQSVFGLNAEYQPSWDEVPVLYQAGTWRGGQVYQCAHPDLYRYFGSLPHHQLIGGRVGPGNRGEPDGQPHTEAQARAIIDNATAAMQARSGAAARALPHLLHLGAMNGFSDPSYLSRLYPLLTGWGLNIRYLHRTGVSAARLDAPAGGPDEVPYTVAQIAAGGLAPDPIFCALGVAANTEIYGPQGANFRAQWPPLPGGLSLLGPSEGSYYAHANMAAGAVGGTASPTHPTALGVTGLFGMFLHLLQGLSVAEAAYWGSCQHAEAVPAGEPLYVPYARD